MYLKIKVICAFRTMIGAINTYLMSLYLDLQQFIRNAKEQELEKVRVHRDTTVVKAKEDVVRAAEKVIKLEQRVIEVTDTADKEYQEKVNKIETTIK